MKKHIKKIVSVLLVCVMSVMSVIAFDMKPIHAASGAITEASGWLETAYVKWTPVSGATGYNVYVKSASASDSAYVQLDDELIRKYPSYMRADAIGLRAGDYVMKIVPINNGKENTSAAIVSDKLTVKAHDRSGFGFVNGTSSGAYNEDGTLKDNAVVIYVTENTKDTVSLDVTGVGECKGIQAILDGFKKKKDKRPLCVRIIGTITDPAVLTKGDLYIDTNVQGLTIEGIGDDAVINGFGIVMKNCDNVEVRNIGIMNVDSNEGDNIGLQQGNAHVWIHNNDYFYGMAGNAADQVKGDGALDTKTSTYVTHSYNHFWDNGKCNLQGMKGEKTTNYITYHHNWYDHSDSRHPRIRTCTVHIYNNYFDGNAKYGVGVTMGASAFVEGNYFRNCPYPMLSSSQGTDSDVLDKGIFSGEAGGIIKAYNNVMVTPKSIIYANSDSDTSKTNSTSFDAYLASSVSEKVPSSYKTVSGGTTYNNFDTDSSVMYSYTAQSPEEAKETVMKFAGRVNGGDFRFTFDNSVDDESYVVNAALKKAVVNYKTTLVSVGGGSIAGESHTHTYGEWVVEKEATEKTEGLKSRTCTVCGDKQTQVIPKKDSSGGSETPIIPATGDSHVHNFTKDGTNSTFFKIVGNLAKNKGTASYGGLQLTQCLKMESTTNISFNAPVKGKLTLVFASGESNKKVVINKKEKTTDSKGVLTVDVSKGNVEIEKGEKINLFYMAYVPEKTDNTDNKAESITESRIDGSYITAENNSELKCQIVKGIADNTKVSEVKSQLAKGNIVIKNSEGNTVADNAVVGTGYTIEVVNNGKTVDSATVIIKGDADGNGTIDVLDMEVVQKAILGIGEDLSGVYKEAARLSATTGELSVLDMEIIQKDILGMSKIN